VRRALWCAALGAGLSGFAGGTLVGQPTAKADSLHAPPELPAPGRVIPAPPPPAGDVPESVTVVLGPQYRVSPLLMLFRGAHYRDLWATPIRLPVLDMARFAGGLTPKEHGGGQQTISLHVMGADGSEYDLRSIDKRPRVNPNLESLSPSVVSDETSAANPVSALVVAPLAKAAGVLHVEPSLYVIPDDPRLGEFRSEFAGMPAEVEVRPTIKDGDEGFAGASKVEKTDKLLETLNTSASDRVDANAYLTARLLDFFVGDWDRGASQWRWARYGDKGDHLWKPVALDRDWAFERTDGVLARLGSIDRRELVSFDRHYPSLFGLTFEVTYIDRRFLQQLERPAFDSAAQMLQRAWTDSVIRDAVDRMPAPMRAKRGAFMIDALRHRRRDLAREADRFYRQLAWDADVHSMTKASVVEITRQPDSVEIRMQVQDAPAVDPYFDRHFVRGETHEVRLYLDGGPDSIVVRGGGDAVKIRIIAGANGDVLVDSTGDDPGQTRIFDHGHPVRVINAHAVGADHRRWTPAHVSPGDHVFDFGESCLVLPGARGGSDEGIIGGLDLTCNELGFRRQPWAVSNTIAVRYATGTGGVSLDYLGQLRPVGSHEIWSLHASATSSQYTWFFGNGDETSKNFGEGSYRGRESYFEIGPGLSIPFDQYTNLTIAPFLRYWQTGQLGGLLAQSRPYGVGPFGSIGGKISAQFDTRDDRGYTLHGVLLDATGLAVPGVWDAREAYGKARATASMYVTPPSSFFYHPTLALRVGGEKVWGVAPYQDMAHIGAAGAGEPFSVRGYIADRFTGTAAAFGNAQVELPLVQTQLVVRTTIGLLAVNDIGRVFVPGEHASQWHDGYGGGFFIAPHPSIVTANVLLVHGTDGTRFYFGYGTGL